MILKRLEVRCCCNPNKVLGHLTHARLQTFGDTWHFTVIDNCRLPEIFVLAGTVHQQVPMKQITLSVDRYSDGNGVVREAIKNRDYTLNELKCIRGFEPLLFDPQLSTTLPAGMTAAGFRLSQAIAQAEHDAHVAELFEQFENTDPKRT